MLIKKIFFLLLASLLCLPAYAGDIDISNRPMETKVESAPPLIMFVIDDSGSMDFTTMTPEAGGTFNGTEYVLPEADPNYYSDVLTGDERLQWKSQWSGYNKIYYNPHSQYQPWHGKTNASTTTPLGNPSRSKTLNLADEYASVMASAEGEIIVDDPQTSSIQDTDHFIYSDTSNWQESGGDTEDEYNGYAKFTSVAAWAEWQFTIPEAGDYEVYAWWDDYYDRDPDAKYTVNYSGGSKDYYEDQSDYTGDWNKLGTHSFSADDYSIRVTRVQNDEGHHSTLADAVRLIPADADSNSTISIKNSHYYTQDSNGNTYLVNLNPTNPSRTYYLLTDKDNDNTVDNGELTKVAADNVPNAIKKAKFDEDGNVTGYYTAAEDLQNFANWYTYYRRREYTAKAAVSQAVRDMESVKAGIYTINHRSENNNVIEPVMPIKVDMAQSDNIVIVDNQDSGYEEVDGSWYDSGYLEPYNNSARYTTNDGKAIFHLNIPETGEYNVYAHHNCCYYRDTNAKYIINHAGESSTKYVNQRDEGENPCGQWIKLDGGPYTFNAGITHSVSVSRHAGSDGSSTLADAVMLESTDMSYANIDRTEELLTELYKINSYHGTPLRSGLKNVGRYLDQDDGVDGGIGPNPFSSEANGGACQKAYAIVMTDGFWNGFSPNVGNTDNDNTSYSGNDPYTDNYADTLADVAMQYYYQDIADSLPDEVPTNSCDQASHQHMATYSVSFGVSGTLDPADLNNDGNPGPYYQDDPCFLNPETPLPQWPDPYDGDQEKIDDLWHAAVNGRGLYFNAQDPDELVNALTEIVSDISLPSSGASVSVNSNEVQEDLAVYQTRYIANSWTGDVIAYPVDPYSGAILKSEDDILWQARNELQNISTSNRNIVTYDGSNAINFEYNSLTTSQQDKLLFSDESSADLAQARLNYIRGDSSNINTYGFRYREAILGDIVHSAPSISPSNKTLYVGANDGMLHAINTETGKERFAYIPNIVFEKLKHLTKKDYNHEFYVDLTPTVTALNKKETYLVGGLGKGGKGFYCLKTYDEDSSGNAVINADSYDMSTSLSSIKNMVQWEYSANAANDDDLGFTYSQPAIVRSNDPSHEWVIIAGNGYNSVNETACLYIFTMDGSLLKKIQTKSTGSNGLSEPSIIDSNNDLAADYVYAGDLNGNLWKFDLSDKDYTNWEIAYKDNDDNPKPLFKTTGQPITSRPDVMYHCKEHGYMVVFGTGKFLGESDRSDTSLQTIYGIWDYGDDADNSEYLGEINNRKATEAILTQGNGLGNQLKLKRQTVVDARIIDSHLTRTLSANTIDWSTVADDSNDQKPNPATTCGWFFDLRTEEDTDDDNDDDTYEGERVIKDVLINNGRAFVTSFTPNSSPCSGGGDSFLYILNACNGGRLDKAQFELNTTDNKIEIDEDSETKRASPTGKLYTGMLHEPTFVTQSGPTDKIYISSSTGEIIEEDLPSEDVGELYWRLLN